MTTGPIDLHKYLLKTKTAIAPTACPKAGTAYVVDQTRFPVLEGMTCYTLEIWEECMRVPHWHPNAAELGYVVSGEIEIMLWRSPGESSVFVLKAGTCWFVPQGALHSLNNVGDHKAHLLVGFSSSMPQDIDLPVAFNGVPAPVRSAYTSPHTALRKWLGPQDNPLVGHFKPKAALKKVLTAAPYGFDFSKVSPLFDDERLGSVVWGVKSNWGILEKISVLRARLKPQTARDPIWYPDANTLYIVVKGEAKFHIIVAGQTPVPLTARAGDYVFVPTGTLHTFMNVQPADFETIAFFSCAGPQPEVSLSVATAFFPSPVRNAAMTEYGARHAENNKGPLDHLNYQDTSPYLLKLDGHSG